MQTFQGELEKQLNDIREGKELALTGLRTLLYLDPAEPIELADKALEPQVRETGSLEQYLTDAHQLRPEFTQAREGVKAYEKLVDATKADYYPVIFFGVVGTLAEASNRDRIKNPFVYDALNDSAIAPVLGVQWKLNLGITAGKVEEAEAELGKIQQKQALGRAGHSIPGASGVPRSRSSTKPISKPRVKAFAVVGNGSWRRCRTLTSGLGQGKDVADAALAYAKLRAGYFQAVYNYNLGLAKLDHVAGRDVAVVQPLLPPPPHKR